MKERMENGRIKVDRGKVLKLKGGEKDKERKVGSKDE